MKQSVYRYSALACAATTMLLCSILFADQAAQAKAGTNRIEAELRGLVKPPPDAISLGSLDPVVVTVGWGDLFVNHGFGGHDTVKILGAAHKDFLFAHSPSKLVYAIPGSVDRFTAIGTWLDHPETVPGVWRYEVFIDGQLVHTGRHATEDVEGHPIDIPVPSDAKILTLKILAGDDGKALANTTWAYPRFHKRKK